MIDVKYPLRKAYTALLSGHLVSGGNIVPVSDSVEAFGPTPPDIYVLFSQQDGNDRSTSSTFNSEENMQINIVSRGNIVSKKTVDNLASQIMTLVLPNRYPQVTALTSPDIDIICTEKTGDRYLVFKESGSSKNVITRILTFSHFVSQ